MRLIRFLFPSKAAKRALAAVEIMVSASENPMAEDLAREAKLLIRRNANHVAFPPELMAARLMQHIAERWLASGDYHIYRGVLSLRGHQLLDFWDYCIRLRRGIKDPEIYDLAEFTLRAALGHKIRDAG